MFLTHALRAIRRAAVTASDAFWNRVTLLLTGAPQVSTFITDASTNNFSLNIFGETRPNNFNPYTPGYYSNIFNGTTDYLSAAQNSAFDITGDFTIECWVYFTALPSPNQDGNRVASLSGYSNGTTANQGFEFGVNFTGNAFAMSSWGSGNRSDCSFTPVLNTWYHLAATKQGSTSRLFINGVSQTLTVNTLAINSAPAGSVLNIGRSSSSSGGALNYFHYVPGYISNFRIVKGTAVYTASFTPLTVPLTAITNTSVLTCADNRFIDNSTNNFAITRNGSPTLSPFDPFVLSPTFRTYGSTYFDGSGDYLSLTGQNLSASNFTIECWVCYSSFSTTAGHVFNFGTNEPNRYGVYRDPLTGRFGMATVNSGGYNVTTGSTVIVLGTWYHLAWVKNGSTSTLYVNGVNEVTNSGAINSGTSWAIGFMQFGGGANDYLTGYVSNFRVVNGTAVYTSAFTPPAAPLTAITNTSLLTLQTNQPVSNSTFIDNSSLGNFITRNGNATQGSYSPYGGNWSNYFDGTGDYLSASNTVSNFGTGDFTMEAWFYKTGANSIIFSNQDGGLDNNYYTLDAVNAAAVFQVRDTNGQTYAYGPAIVDNTWVHVAVTRSSGSVRVFINGVSGTPVTITKSVTQRTTLIGGFLYTGYETSFNGYISNVRIVKGTAVYTANFTPPTTPLTAIANTSLLTCADNRIIDDSPNNFAITRNGDVSVQRFSPFSPVSSLPVSYGAYFDGTGDYLTLSAGSSFAFGTGDFTVECWLNVSGNSSSSSKMLLDSRNSSQTNTWVFGIGMASADGKLAWWTGAAAPVSDTVVATNDVWTHFAVTRFGTTLRLFVNGVLKSSATDSTNYSVAPTTSYIGSRYSLGDYFSGYISNLRVTKGTAVYTTNFTPPTLPLTAIANTSLLTCQSNRFIDNSTNNFTITNNGDARPVTQNPFGFTNALTTGYDVTTVSGSAYFDGTGDFLTFTGGSATSLEANFTLEGWVYLTSVPVDASILGIGKYESNGSIFYVDTSRRLGLYRNSSRLYTGSGSLLLNTWNHIAYVRQGTTLTGYINGVSQGSITFSATIAESGGIGTYISNAYALTGLTSNFINGYISDLRIIKGTALYTGPFVPPVAPVTAITNTTFLGNFANAGVYDASMLNDLETVGDAKLSTAVSKYSGSSLFFDGTGDYLTVPTNAAFGYSTGDFTIEFWVYFNNVTADQTVVSNLTSATSVNPHIYYFGNNGIRYYTSSADRITGSVLSASTWHHIAVCRASGSTRLFINGTQSGATYTDANNYGTSAPLGVGTYWSAGSPVTTSTLNGYIDDLRITKSARYTANFTPPTAALPTF